MFALNVQRPELLYTKVVEVDERVTLAESTSYQRGANDEAARSGGSFSENEDDDNVVVGISGERVRVLQPLDLPAVVESLQQTYDEGFHSVAICLLHSYTFPDHEASIVSAAEKIASHLRFGCFLVPVPPRQTHILLPTSGTTSKDSAPVSRRKVSSP